MPSLESVMSQGELKCMLMIFDTVFCVILVLNGAVCLFVKVRDAV